MRRRKRIIENDTNTSKSNKNVFERESYGKKFKNKRCWCDEVNVRDPKLFPHSPFFFLQQEEVRNILLPVDERSQHAKLMNIVRWKEKEIYGFKLRLKKFVFFSFFFFFGVEKIQQRKNPVVALVVFNQCGTNTNNPIRINSFQ